MKTCAIHSQQKKQKIPFSSIHGPESFFLGSFHIKVLVTPKIPSFNLRIEDILHCTYCIFGNSFLEVIINQRTYRSMEFYA